MTIFPYFLTYLKAAPSPPRWPAKRKRVSPDCPNHATGHRQEQFLCHSSTLLLQFQSGFPGEANVYSFRRRHDVPFDDGILADTAGIRAHAEDSVIRLQTLTPGPGPLPPPQIRSFSSCGTNRKADSTTSRNHQQDGRHVRRHSLRSRSQ